MQAQAILLLIRGGTAHVIRLKALLGNIVLILSYGSKTTVRVQPRITVSESGHMWRLIILLYFINLLLVFFLLSQ